MANYHLSIQMERRGIRTELGNRNRDVAVTNKQMSMLRARIKKLTDWLYSQPLTGAPTMADMVNGITGGQKLKSHWKQIADLQAAAKVLIYKKHSEEITLYENAKSYLDKIMNGHTSVPVKAWEKERDTLTAERLARVDEYYKLKDDVQNVERLRSGEYYERYCGGTDNGAGKGYGTVRDNPLFTSIEL